MASLATAKGRLRPGAVVMRGYGAFSPKAEDNPISLMARIIAGPAIRADFVIGPAVQADLLAGPSVIARIITRESP